MRHRIEKEKKTYDNKNGKESPEVYGQYALMRTANAASQNSHFVFMAFFWLRRKFLHADDV